MWGGTDNQEHIARSTHMRTDWMGAAAFNKDMLANSIVVFPEDGPGSILIGRKVNA
jgi:hypothetical protein